MWKGDKLTAIFMNLGTPSYTDFWIKQFKSESTERDNSRIKISAQFAGFWKTWSSSPVTGKGSTTRSAVSVTGSKSKKTLKKKTEASVCLARLIFGSSPFLFGHLQSTECRCFIQRQSFSHLWSCYYLTVLKINKKEMGDKKTFLVQNMPYFASAWNLL